MIEESLHVPKMTANSANEPNPDASDDGGEGKPGHHHFGPAGPDELDESKLCLLDTARTASMLSSMEKAV